MTTRRRAPTKKATPMPSGPALVTRVGAALAVTLLGCGPAKRSVGPPPELPPQRDSPPQLQTNPGDGYAQPPPDEGEDVGPVPPMVPPPQPPQVAPQPYPPPQPPQVRPPQVRPPQPPQVRPPQPPQVQSPPPMIPQAPQVQKPPQVQKAPQVRKAPQINRAPVRPEEPKIAPQVDGQFPAPPPPLVGPFDRKKR